MQDQGKANWLVIVLSVLLVVAVIGAVIGGVGLLKLPKQLAKPAAPSMLPRVVVTVDEQGVPSAFGVSLTDIGRLAGMDLSGFRLPPETVQQLMAADIQHFEVVVVDHGLFFFVNAQPLPYLATDEETWKNLEQVMSMFQVPNQGLVQWVLDKIVPRFGLQVAFKLPRQEGVAEIPLRDPNTLPEVSVDEVRAAVTERSLVAYVDVNIDADGVPSIAGVSLGQIQEGLQKAGMALDLSTARLDPGLVAMLTAANVQHLQIETEPEGLYLYLNGMRLPRLSWDAERLANVVDLIKRLSPENPYLSLVDVVVPGIQPADVEMTVFLPKAPDAEEVPTSEFVSMR